MLLSILIVLISFALAINCFTPFVTKKVENAGIILLIVLFMYSAITSNYGLEATLNILAAVVWIFVYKRENTND